MFYDVSLHSANAYIQLLTDKPHPSNSFFLPFVEFCHHFRHIPGEHKYDHGYNEGFQVADVQRRLNDVDTLHERYRRFHAYALHMHCLCNTHTHRGCYTLNNQYYTHYTPRKSSYSTNAKPSHSQCT